MTRNWSKLIPHLLADYCFRIYNKYKSRQIDKTVTSGQADDLIGGYISSKNEDLVSIVLPTFNPRKKYLMAAVLSCLRQTHKNFELIVVDDGSKIILDKFCLRFGDRRIRYIRHQTNKGLAAALNSGFRRARGKYLTWTSDDNLYAAEALELMIGYSEEKKADMVYADYYLISPKGHVLRCVFNRTPEYLETANCIGFCFLYKKSIYESIGDYKETDKFKYIEDYDYWLRVKGGFKIEKLNRCLYFTRIHPGSLSYKHTWKTYRKFMQLIRPY